MYYIKQSRDPSRLSWAHQTDSTDRDQCTPLKYTIHSIDVFLLLFCLGKNTDKTVIVKCLLGADLRPVDVSAAALRTVEDIDHVECVDIDSANKAYWLELQGDPFQRVYDVNYR